MGVFHALTHAHTHAYREVRARITRPGLVVLGQIATLQISQNSS